MKIFYHFLILSVAVFATPFIVKEGIVINPAWTVLIVGAILYIINTLVKPIINILTLPINLITFGLFSIVVNGLIFWFLGQGYIDGFSILTFKAAFLGSVVVSVINYIGGKILNFD